MHRPGGVPQSLRGIPSGFNGQQQPPQQTRSVSSRLPNGKIGGNTPGWALGSGVPLSGVPLSGGASTGGAGLQNPARQQQMGGSISFAQSLGGSQPATPLDLSEFPTLSNSSQLANAGQPSLWSTAGTRNIGGQSIQRNANTPLSSQQSQQDDIFNSTARLPSNQVGSFRFSSQGSIGQAVPPSQPATTDDFPPLNRSANAGEIGQDRGASLMSSIGYGSQASVTSPAPQPNRMGNGLLNALSANATRAGSDVRSPVGTRPQEARSLVTDEDGRQRQDGDAVQSPIGGEVGSAQQGGELRNSIGAAGGDAPSSAKLRGESEAPANAVQDPLAGMAPIDRWGMKGLRTLISNPEYSAVVSAFGLDIRSLGVDLNANELLSTQTYSLFDAAPPRPAIPKFRLPECYKVSNVGPIENKISSFNEETLMWIFYSCPNDIKQQLAAIELNNRNWRWHKRQQLWLTKDDLMMPQVLSMTHERGYYIVWDTATWRKARTDHEITLNYADLDNAPVAAGGVV